MSDELAARIERLDRVDGLRWELAAARAEALQTRGVLLDLIAELVGDDGDGHELTPGKDDTCLVCEAIDRAEARLREVLGDE